MAKKWDQAGDSAQDQKERRDILFLIRWSLIVGKQQPTKMQGMSSMKQQQQSSSAASAFDNKEDGENAFLARWGKRISTDTENTTWFVFFISKEDHIHLPNGATGEREQHMPHEHEADPHKVTAIAPVATVVAAAVDAAAIAAVVVATASAALRR